MLTIDIIRDGRQCTLFLTGRLDTATAPQLEDTLLRMDATVKALTLNMTDLDYLSSAGLRTLLKLQTTFALTLTGVSEGVKEVLEVTGYIGFLKIL